MSRKDLLKGTQLPVTVRREKRHYHDDGPYSGLAPSHIGPYVGKHPSTASTPPIIQTAGRFRSKLTRRIAYAAWMPRG
jgi:hypothetical protein